MHRRGFDANLLAIGRLLSQSGADIVALQEVDKPSLWSGGFDHAEHIASKAGYGWRTHAGHAKSWLFDYGTAILSRLPIVDTGAAQFAPSPPTFRKGFVIGRIALPSPADPAQSLEVDVVSVHMDFLSEKTRARQIDELIEALSHRQNPMIVLGDFNSEWRGERSPMRKLVDRLGLKVHRPDSERLATHGEARIDWILVSPALRFESYTVLPDAVSDHRAVLAEIGFSDELLLPASPEQRIRQAASL